MIDKKIFWSLNIWQAAIATKRNPDLFCQTLLGLGNSGFGKGDMKPDSSFFVVSQLFRTNLNEKRCKNFLCVRDVLPARTHIYAFWGRPSSEACWLWLIKPAGFKPDTVCQVPTWAETRQHQCTRTNALGQSLWQWPINLKAPCKEFTLHSNLLREWALTIIVCILYAWMLKNEMPSKPTPRQGTPQDRDKGYFGKDTICP